VKCDYLTINSQVVLVSENMETSRLWLQILFNFVMMSLVGPKLEKPINNPL